MVDWGAQRSGGWMDIFGTDCQSSVKMKNSDATVVALTSAAEAFAPGIRELMSISLLNVIS